MTDQELAALRRFWKECKDIGCKHSIVVGLRRTGGALIGIYVCARCGEEVYRRND